MPSAGSTSDPRPARPADSTAVLSCRQVGQVYPSRRGGEQVVALHEVTRDFAAGRVTTIAGPSGSGKSTLLRILACVDRPASGTVELDGVDIGRASTRRRRALRRRRLAYVFQNPGDNLVEYLSASEQVRLAGELRGSTVEAGEVTRVLELLGLSHRVAARPGTMSGGEQQRLAIACAVVGGPALVLADEPTAELDSASGARALQALHDLREEGVAFAVSSHDPAVIEASDHLLRLDRGRPVESW